VIRAIGRGLLWIISGAFSAYVNALAFVLTWDKSTIGPLH
jgi:hypothetical protein